MPPIAEYPPVFRPEYINSAETKVSHLGPSVFASWRPEYFLSNEKLLSMVSAEEREDAGQIIKASGINRRYVTPSIYMDGVEIDQVRENTATIGAHLVRTTMNERDLDPAQLKRLVITSLFLDDEIAEIIADKAGLSSHTKLISYRVACAGFAAAFIDSLANPDLVDEETIIASMEPLGALFHQNHFVKENFSIPSIFGDHYISFGYRPGDYRLVYAESHVIPDNGVIKCKTFYDTPAFDRQLLPDHYTVGEDGEAIFGISDNGIYLNIQEPEGDISATMRNLNTAGHFGKHMPPIWSRVYQHTQDRVRGQYALIFHNPSTSVVTLVNKKTDKSWSRPDLSVPEMPFLLDYMRASNESSATTPDLWQFLVDQHQIRADDPFFIGAPGIGSLITIAGVLPNF